MIVSYRFKYREVPDYTGCTGENRTFRPKIEIRTVPKKKKTILMTCTVILQSLTRRRSPTDFCQTDIWRGAGRHKKPHSIFFILMACLYFKRWPAISFNFQLLWNKIILNKLRVYHCSHLLFVPPDWCRHYYRDLFLVPLDWWGS